MPPQDPLPTITPPPLPRSFDFGPTPTELIERDSIVTVSVVASNAATSSAAKKATAFPFAVAIPALVGGMALAIAGFCLYWWIGRKQKREKRVGRSLACPGSADASRNDGSERKSDNGNEPTLLQRDHPYPPREIRPQPSRSLWGRKSSSLLSRQS